MATIEEVRTELQQVYDPEIPVNILDLGLVYDIRLDGETCHIKMTLTSQACPEAKTIPDMVKRRVTTLAGISRTEVDVVWEPAWSPQLISPEGRTILGLDENPED
jgi:metal-sulfur cluster biosynthetic enzyme